MKPLRTRTWHAGREKKIQGKDRRKREREDGIKIDAIIYSVFGSGDGGGINGRFPSLSSVGRSVVSLHPLVSLGGSGATGSVDRELYYMHVCMRRVN